MNIIAHRGYSSERPENTIASFDHAINSGFPYFELDIHLTSDDIPVVMHDARVDRTTNGSGEIRDMTLTEIKSLDAGSWFSVLYSCEKVPSLSEVLVRYKNKAHIFIEIKSNQEAIVEILRNLLVEFDWMPKIKNCSITDLLIPGVSIVSFITDQLLFSKTVLPEISHGLLLGEPDKQSMEFCVNNGLKGFFPYFGAITKDIVDIARQKELYVGAWGLESSEQITKAIDFGVEGVTVDWPGEATKFLE
jgi:glycerophosphoryl diester phosphodiesterase